MAMNASVASLFGGAVLLVCPRDHEPLVRSGDRLTCMRGHCYDVADGIPILLTDAQETHWGFQCRDPVERESDLAHDREIRAGDHAIDPDVNKAVVWSSGNLYRSMLNKLKRYPIPDIRLPAGDGQLLLDIGCSWGRWSIAAARKGYRVVGVDPSFASVLCARRVARQLGIDAAFIVSDARHLPFANHSIDTLFSYSVLQHLTPHDVGTALSDFSRVLRPGGTSLIQMANCFGMLSLYHQARRGFRAARYFEVSFYMPRQMRKEMEQRIGPTHVSVDGYFGLGIQPADIDLMPMFERTIIFASEALRRISKKFPPLKMVADSLYFESRAE